jgi:chromosome segregation ATPase
MTCTLTDPHDCANVRAANDSLRRHLNRACDERDAALAREKAAAAEGVRLAAEVANLRDELASWRKGVEDANRISQRERAAADAARAEADTLRHVAETVSARAHELAGQAQALETRRFLLEKRLARVEALATQWETDALRFGVVARGSTLRSCAEASARIAADRRERASALRAALAARANGSSANAEEVGHAAGAGKAGPPSLSTTTTKEQSHG